MRFGVFCNAKDTRLRAERVSFASRFGMYSTIVNIFEDVFPSSSGGDKGEGLVSYGLVAFHHSVCVLVLIADSFSDGSLMVIPEKVLTTNV